MDYNKILDDAKKLLELTKSNTEDKEEFEKKMQERFNTIYKQQPSIFKMCVDGFMDIERLTYMINMVKKVKSNNMSEHDASVQVGQRLVDEFVKPKIEEN